MRMEMSSKSYMTVNVYAASDKFCVFTVSSSSLQANSTAAVGCGYEALLVGGGHVGFGATLLLPIRSVLRSDEKCMAPREAVTIIPHLECFLIQS